jgi:HlyD family secretion protein
MNVRFIFAALRPWRALLLVAAILLVAIAWYIYANPGGKPGATVAVTRGDIRATVSANARVRAAKSARLAFPNSGLIANVNVQEGDTVKAGDVLAEMKSDEFDRRIKQAELNLASRQLDLSKAQSPPQTEELDIAQSNLKKAAVALAAAQDAYKKNATSANQGAQEIAQADYDIARDNFDRLTRGPSNADLQQLKNAVAAAQLDLDAARAAKAQTQLRAPFDGVVTQVNANPGELIGGFTPLLSLADTTNLELLADIDEIDVGAVAPNQTVEIRFDAFPGKTVNGSVTRLFPAASTDRGASVYQARVKFDASDLAIRPGMGATIKIATVERKNVLLLPSNAIKNAGPQKIVTMLINGARQNIVVLTGLSDGNETEIVSGLREGAMVVIE